MMNKVSTIAAISTPAGSGGVGIIKLSGPDALHIGGSIFKRSKNKPVAKTSCSRSPNGFKSHYLYHGHIIAETPDRIIDEVLFTYMKGPHSYTGEDVVEIQAHSGRIVLASIVDLVFEKGAILAEPGEFTRRAFLNGRIDLTQAEAVVDLIQAKSVNSLEMAVSHLHGNLKKKISNIREILLNLMVQIEAAIDFPDDVEDVIDYHDVIKRMDSKVIKPLHQFIDSYECGHLYREGVSLVIIGRPNVGKSSLLNCLIDQERAIVTAFPGTTRDTLEEYLNIEGIPLRITDTAGIHTTDDPVEKIGIEKAKEKLAESSFIIFMTDARDILNPDEALIIESIPKEKIIFVVNKADLVQTRISSVLSAYPENPCVPTSALHGKGITKLKKVIKSKIILNPTYGGDLSLAPNLRQKFAMERAVESIERARAGMDDQLPAELFVLDLKESVDLLGEVMGDEVKSDVLDQIFDQFCIGK